MERTCVFTLLNIIWIVNVNCVQGNERVHNIDTIPVKITEHYIRKRSVRPSNDISLDFQISSKPVILRLKENAQLKHSIPVYVISEDGSLKREEIHSKLQKTNYFYDTINGASFYIQFTGKIKSHMYGTFHVDNEEYILEYKNNISNIFHKESGHQKDVYHFKVWKTPTHRTKHHKMQDTNTDIGNSTYRHARRKRSPTYHVEILFVVDYSIYKYWYDQSKGSTHAQKDSQAKASLYQFYAFVVNGIDGRYRSIGSNFMSVVYISLIISESRSASPWTETLRSGNNVDAHSALNKFSEWTQKKTDLPSHDHAMLLTRYILSSGGSSDLEGYAYVRAVCSHQSQSIMKESDDYVMMTVAAHELGHSLGAKHDGDGNSCRQDDYYVMAASSKPALGNPNPWRFSTCSVQYFQETIRILDSRGKNCMTSFGKDYNPGALNAYQGQLPGQLYTADEQCVRVLGKGSSLCREHYYGKYTELCGLMWCRDLTTGGCGSMVPGDGTPCGNKKWCINGVCTPSSRAPSVPDNCVHGDYIGSMDQYGNTCDSIVSKDKTECYRKDIETPCCGTCGKVSSGVPGCFYGDRIPSSLCNKTACPYYSKDELSHCCQTCIAYFAVPVSPILPTESDGTNEILTGVSVGILVIAIICGIYIQRRRKGLCVKKSALARKRKDKFERPWRPPPSKPIPMTNGGPKTKRSNSTNLISNPILNSHTNKNLKIDSQRQVNSTTKRQKENTNPKISSKPNSDSKKPAKMENEKRFTVQNPDLQSNTGFVRQKPKYPPSDSSKSLLEKDKIGTPKTESDGVVSLKDRIAALNHVPERPVSSHIKTPEQKDSTKFDAKSSRQLANQTTESKTSKARSGIQKPADKFEKQPLRPPTTKPLVNKNLDKIPMRPPQSRPSSSAGITTARTTRSQNSNSNTKNV